MATGSRIKGHKPPKGRTEARAAPVAVKISDAFGMLKWEGQKPVSTDEMSEVIADGWAGRS